MDTTFRNADRIEYDSNWSHYDMSSRRIFHRSHIFKLCTQLPTNRHCPKSTNLCHLRGNSYFWHNQKPMEKTYEFHKRVPKFVLWTQCAHDLITPHSSGRIDQAKHKRRRFISTHVAFIHPHNGILGLSNAHAACCPFPKLEPVLVMTIQHQVNGWSTQTYEFPWCPWKFILFPKE